MMFKLSKNFAAYKLAAGIFYVLAFFCFSSTAYSLNFNLGKEMLLDVDVQLKYGAAIRVEDQDSKLLSNPNGDDGNRNFEQWDLINNRFTVTVDADLQRKNLGLFVRPRAYYDFVYMTDNSNDSPGTVNKFGANDEFHDKTEDLHGKKAEILDAFVYGTFNSAGHPINLRVGQQVVQWGTSLFVPGISSAQGPVDATIANTPGIEFKELLLPTEQAYVQVGLTDSISLTGFYQWEWERSRIDESGSFFNAADFLFEGGDFLITPFGNIPKVDDKDADDSGQWGAGLLYRAEWLKDTEFGFYYINYHDKGPQVNVGPSGVFLSYAEDIKLYGFSVAAQIVDTAVNFETNYRKDFPVSTTSGNKRAEVWQAQASYIHLLPPALFWDQILLLGEVGFNQVYGLDGAKLATADEFAWGGTASFQFDFLNILVGHDLNLSVPLTYAFNPNGISAVAGTFTEKADSFSIATNFTYNQVYKIDLSYTGFVGGAGSDAKADRDYLSLSLKYTF
jgi:hypothetical protein